MVESNKFFQFVAHLIMIILTMFCLLPFVLLIASSMTSEVSLIQQGYKFFPSQIDFAAYKLILLDSKSILRAYGVSVITTVVGTTLNVVLTVLFAYPLSRKDLPGRNIFSFFLFFTMLFNGGLVPSYIMWTNLFHIKNTFWALITPNLLMSAFNVIMMRTYFTTSIPNEIIQAAKVDGASEVRILIQIVIPMAKPIMATIALLAALAYWNDWLNGLYYISKQSMYSVQVLLNRMLLDTQFLKSSASVGLSIDTSKIPSTGIKMAVAVLGALPIMVVYPIFQKSFVKGITIGAIKG